MARKKRASRTNGALPKAKATAKAKAKARATATAKPGARRKGVARARRAAEAFGPSDEFFRAVADEATLGIMAFDLDSGLCVYANALAREALETPLGSEEAARTLRAADLEPAEWREPLRPFSPDVWRLEGLAQDVVVRKANGGSFIANVGIKHLAGAGGARLLLLMLQDVTYQKKLQRDVLAKQEAVRLAYQELLEQNKQLKELDLAKDKFIALMSHELRTPLAAIVAVSEVVSMGLCETPEQKDKFIQDIHEQSLHLMELVNDVLDFAKIQAGKMEYFVEEHDLRAALEKTVAIYGNMAEQAKVKLELLAPPAGEKAWFDLLRFKEVVGNVVNNAIKYNRPGGWVRVSVELDSDRARVLVADSGPGIAPENVASVFNEFETVGQIARHHKGTGLGMPISKKLAQGMGGDLTLESVVGQGTTFRIDLPRAKVLPAETYRARPDAWGDFAA